MVSFELGKEKEKDVFRLVTSVGQITNSESPWGIEYQILRFRAPILYHWATETPRWAKFMTNTVRISNVDSVMFVNRIREMVSFERGKEIEKDIFCLVTSVGQITNSESPWGIEYQILRFRAPILYHWATETPQWAKFMTNTVRM